MNTSAHNPPSNVIPNGISTDALEASVKSSGYPLQTVVAVCLKQHFTTVVEEWGFIDRETERKRALDLFALKYLSEEDDTRFYPSLILLIECKRSDLPFVFFKSVTQKEIPGFPPIHGLRSKKVPVSENKRTRYEYVSQVLKLPEHNFIKDGAVICNTFSRVSRKGQALELSGIDPYNNIVLPLVSAVEHSYIYYRSPAEKHSRYPNVVIPVCVMDAPMVVADATKENNDLTLSPWVRVVRQEAVAREDSRGHDRHYEYHGIDIVHFGFLEQFITQHVLPFGDYFRDQTLNQNYF